MTDRPSQEMAAWAEPSKPSRSQDTAEWVVAILLAIALVCLVMAGVML